MTYRAVFEKGMTQGSPNHSERSAAWRSVIERGVVSGSIIERGMTSEYVLERGMVSGSVTLSERGVVYKSVGPSE